MWVNNYTCKSLIGNWYEDRCDPESKFPAFD